jgi:hypothetical protein
MILTEFYDEVDHLKEDVLAKRVAEIRDSQGPEYASSYQKTLFDFSSLTDYCPPDSRISRPLRELIRKALQVDVKSSTSNQPLGQDSAMIDLSRLVDRDPDRNWVSPTLNKRLDHGRRLRRIFLVP